MSGLTFRDPLLAVAIVASLFLHAAALTVAVPLAAVKTADAPLRLAVRLLVPPPSPAAAPVERVGPSLSDPLPAARPPPSRVSAARPARSEPMAAVRRAEPPSETATPSSAKSGEAESAVSAEARTAAHAPTVSESPFDAMLPAPPADALKGYGERISRVLSRYKEYPRVAQMRGWEGAVTMRLRVAPSGELLNAELHASSGHEVLDRQALAMATRAERLPLPPEDLRGGEIAVLVPIVFRLER